MRNPENRDDAACYDGVVLPHLDSAYSLARWLTRDAVLAQDVVQDAALRALRYFGSFRGGDPRAWFMQIVRNAAHGALAARGQLVAELPDNDVRADPADDPEAALVRREDRDDLARALSALPLDLRECLVLRELEELSYKQIAEITGAPIGTVMSRLWRARQLLLARRGDAK
jgi:RNA polymerase sigma factor (sigma-70 family)